MAENNAYSVKNEYRSQYYVNTASDQNAARTRNRVPRHPPHLRGKEIGLYYARLNRERKNKEYSQATGSREGGNCCGHSHRQKDFQVPIILDCEDMRRTLYEIANTVIPCCSETSDENSSRIRKRYYPVDEVSSTLMQNENTDGSLFQNFVNRPTKSPLQAFRRTLPAHKMQHDILNTLEYNQVVVVMGETGCGKTTQIPQFILDSFISAGKGSMCKVVCTQPRRISAITVAERVAQERGVPCGQKK